MEHVCRSALDALDHVMGERPDRIYEELTAAVRCLVRLRDHLILERRAGGTTPASEARLRQVNAVLSLVVGGEYPLVGLRIDRVRQARDELAKLLAA